MFKRFFQKNRKLLSGLFVVVLLLVAFTPVPAHAAGFCDIWVIGEGVCGLVLVPMQISAMILYIAGILFDFVIQFTIVDITKNLSNITGINIAWAVIRDLVNISFIFILLYAAIQAILNNTTGHIKQLIVGVVIAAILINFSLFFTKIIIDGSNLVTLTFQKSMTAKCEGKLSFCVMQNLGLPTTYKTDGGLVQSVDGYNKNVLDQVHGEIWKAIILSIGSSIFFLITAFIFLAASVMFVMRFVTIVFLLIFSPLAVIGSILPKLSQKKDEWWSELTEQAIFPALFMLLMWVVLTILASPGFITRKGSISGALIGGAKIDSPEGLNNLSMIFNFGIIIAFMIGVLTISKGYSKRGGAMGGKFAGTIIGGGGGAIGRATLGRAGQMVATNKTLKEMAPDSRLARLALSAGKGTASASFDARGAKIPGTEFGLPKSLGAGKAGGKGGFVAEREAKIKARMKQAEDFDDKITGEEVESEMDNKRWYSQDDRDFLASTGRYHPVTGDRAGVGLTPAQVAAINAGGMGKDRVERLGLDARQMEAMRRRVQGDLLSGSARESARRRERFIHNISQTSPLTPNLYTGVSEDTEAARRLRDTKSDKDKLIEALDRYRAGTTPPPPPATPTPPPPTP